MPTVVLFKLMSDSIIHYPLGNWNDYPDAPIILRAGKHNKIIRLKDLPEVFEKQTINLHDVELGSYANAVSGGFVFYLNADANYIILDCNNWNKWLLENKWVKVAGGYSAMKYPTTVIRLSEYTGFFFVHRDYGNGVSHLQLIGKNGKRITLRLPPYIRKLSGYRETPDGLILTALKKKYSQILYIRLKGNLGVFLLDTVPIGESHDTPKKVRDYLMTWEILGQFGDFHIYKTCDRQDSVLLISPAPIQQLNSAVLNGRALEIGKEYPDTQFIEIPYKSP